MGDPIQTSMDNEVDNLVTLKDKSMFRRGKVTCRNKVICDYIE
jgi:hypothetical protein